MALEPLISVVEIVKRRIQRHGQALRHSEAQTRYALIDPVLRELGWDISDPELVRPEDWGAGGYADYTLLSNGKAVALLEAKKLGEHLNSAIDQALNYCNQRGIGYMLISDGDLWVMYEVFRQAPIEQRRLVNLSLQSDKLHEAVLRLLYFWQPNLGSGTVASPINVAPLPQTIHQPVQVVDQPTPLPEPVQESGWVNLSQIYPNQSYNPRPQEIRFHTGEIQSTSNKWRGVPEEVVKWLVKNQRLTANAVPDLGLNFISSVQKNQRFRQVVEGIYLDANHSAQNNADHSRQLLSKCKVDPEAVELRFE